MTVNLILNRLSMTVGLLLLAGCATVTVTRVTDDDFKTQGVRFYRPRPYIVVNQPFPIGGDDFYVYGRIDAQNRVVRIDISSLPEPLKSHFAGVSQYTCGIPFTDISQAPTAPPAPPAPGSLGQQGGEQGGKRSSPTSTQNNEQPTTKPAGDQASSASTTQPTTQQSTLRTSSDPTIDPYEKLNEYLGIVYLPDFDQQYAMSASSGLGSSSASIQMKNAWMVENIDWNVDNTQLGQFLYSNISRFAELAATVAEQAVAPGSAELSALAQQGGTQPIVVLLKVNYVIQASPGIYPILKPTEAGGYFHSGTGDNISGKTQAPPVPDANLVNQSHVLLPLSPYTVVAYNYTTKVSIQLVSAVPPATVTQKPNDQTNDEKSDDTSPTPLSVADAKTIDDFVDKNLGGGVTRLKAAIPNYQISTGVVSIVLTGPDGTNIDTVAQQLTTQWQSQNPVPTLSVGAVKKFSATLAVPGVGHG
jgi:hypothetical protein